MKFLIIIFIGIRLLSFSQGNFSNPLDIPMYLSGSFAELRSNHFHSGIDIKTNEEIGFPVYAVQEGWVSRVKVSPWGFGYAIYIAHPTGYTSVYAHLSRFNSEIGERVLNKQYSEKSFAVDMYFKKGEIPIKQADIIAFTGNTGGSGGPHLHFEMRETTSQKPINPLQFKFDIKDTLPPEFINLVLYNTEENKQFFRPVYFQDKYLIEDTILVDDNFELGIVTRDKSNDSDNPLGINKIKYYLGDVLMYSYENERFSFSETRYVNAHIDYAEYKTKKRRVQKMFVEPGNLLSCYSNVGKYKQINAKQWERGRVEIYDSKNNKSSLEFILKRKDNRTSQNLVIQPNSIKFSFRSENTFKKQDSIEVYIPKGALYKDINFFCTVTEDTSYLGHLIYSVHKFTTPLHKKMTLKIRMPKIDKDLQSNLLIVEKEGRSLTALKTKIQGNYLVTRTKYFGDYTVALDTVPPKIILEKLDLSQTEKSIIFIISDNLSGISSYNAYIDNRWILLKYDYKTHQLYYNWDKHIKKLNQQRKFLLKVTDAVGNISIFEKLIDY